MQSIKTILMMSALFAGFISPAYGLDPTPFNPPTPLPNGIKVSPEQGFVDISNTAYPQGVSNIGLDFTQEIVVNPDNTTPAELYFEENPYAPFDTPASTTLSASVDPLSWKTAGVLFKDRSWKRDGYYKVVIPEGMFCYASGVDAEGLPTGTEPTPGLTLYYEIYLGYTLLPAGGIVEQVSEATLFFRNVDEIIPQKEAAGISFYMDNNVTDTYTVSYEIIPSSNGLAGLDVRFTISKNGQEGPVTEPGIYGFNIPAGAFRTGLKMDGAAPGTDDTLYRTNNEILVKYVIPRFPQPEIDPDPSFAVTSFEDFMIYLPEGLDLFFADTMGRNNLYRVDEDGLVDTSKVYAYAKVGAYDSADGFIRMNLYDPATHQLLESYTPDPGEYCLRTVNALLYGEWTEPDGSKFTGGSDPYDYFYTVNKPGSGVECIPTVGQTSEGGAGVYNLNGIRVASADDPESLRRLPAGLYISAGRKLIIR